MKSPASQQRRRRLAQRDPRPLNKEQAKLLEANVCPACRGPVSAGACIECGWRISPGG